MLALNNHRIYIGDWALSRSASLPASDAN
jgi:hypothetical protein